VRHTGSSAADRAKEADSTVDDVTSSSRDDVATSDGGGGDASRPEQQDMLTALQGFLGQHASSREDPKQAAFEHAVLAYVQGQYADAVQQLSSVKAAAVKAGQQALAADACRWLGHAQAKRGDAVRAVAAFAEGAHLAQSSGSRKLQVRQMIQCISR
jgi:TolA-binding protein